jgi:triosephosphate isomerase
MRKNIVAGNWKMNTDRQSGAVLIVDLLNELPDELRAEVIIAPPFPLLGSAADLLIRDGRIQLAAQNCHHEPSGAYTGEVAATMLASYGVSHVILGHSERRQFFHEDDGLIRRKMDEVMHCGMHAIWCCGEVLAEREAGRHMAVVERQLTVAFNGFSPKNISRLIVAYEPVWAIGTGRTASPAEAQEMHAFIRAWLTSNLGSDAAQVSILYGGSVKASNARELFAQPDIDGGLIGGASLKADEFLAICSSF